MNDAPGGIRRIIYTSKALYLPDAGVDDIYRSSIRRNRQDDVTGLLLYDGARFLQAIEGAEAVVLATMARILQDRRHRHVHFAFHGTVAARVFPAWSMTQAGPRPNGGSQAFMMQVKRDVEPLGDAQLQALFIGFAKLAMTHRA